MESFFRKQKLIDSISINLNCNKATFIEKFKENVLFSDFSFNPFEVLQSSEKAYKGNIQNSNFTIQKVKTLFNGKKQYPLGKGKIIENIDGIKLEIEINGINTFFKIFYTFISLFYLLFAIGIFFIISKNDEFPLFVIPLIFIHALAMYAIPFFLIRSAVKNFKYEIEREFHFWIK